MKKNIFGGIVIFIIIAMAAINININLNQERGISLLVLANVEALADENSSPYQGTTASCTQTVVTETYIASGGWTWDVSAKVWLLNGHVSHTTPPSYEKVTTTTTSSWQGCKPNGSTSCTAPAC